MQPLSHLNSSGQAHMVDVGEKPVTRREAIAEGFVAMSPEAALAIRQRSTTKGDVLQIATLAAIQAAKQTAQWIPLCHVIALEHVDVNFAWPQEQLLRIEVTVRSSGKTGVEMEAMTATTAAALTIYDMCKSIDRNLVIEKVQLVSKNGGTRGPYVRSQPNPDLSQ